MAASDWIAIAAVLISLGSIGLSWYTFRRQEQSDAEGELATLVGKIQEELAKLGPALPTDRSIDLVMKNSTVNAALQGLVLRVDELVTDNELEPDWFETVVTARAFIGIGDMAGAEHWVSRAVDAAFNKLPGEHAGERPIFAVLMSLRMKGMFLFQRSGPGDADAAREVYKLARDEVTAARDQQGPVFTSSSLIELWIGQASFEIAVGGDEIARGLVRGACDEWRRLEPPAARFGMCQYITTFLLNQFVISPASLALPGEFMAEATRLPYEAPPPEAPPSWWSFGAGGPIPPPRPMAPPRERPTAGFAAAPADLATGRGS